MRKFLGIVFLVILVVVGGYFAATIFTVSEQNEAISDTVSQITIQQCQEIKNSACNLNGTVSREDYSENCFRDGESILEEPYTCPS